MPPFFVLFVNLGVAAALFAAAASLRGRTRSVRRGSVLLAALPLLDAAMLAAYVFGEDSYRHDGTSRWDAYRTPGGALGAMFVASVALMVAGAVVLAYAVTLRSSYRLFRASSVTVAVVALLLLTSTIIGFSTN